MKTVDELTVNLQVHRISSDITFVCGDDWIAMYVDGVKMAEGHSLAYFHILDALGIKYERQDAPTCDPDEGEVVFGETLGDVAVWRYEDNDNV